MATKNLTRVIQLPRRPRQSVRKNSVNQSTSILPTINYDNTKYPEIYTHVLPKSPSIKRRSRKHVRFALQLESVPEESVRLLSANPKNITKPHFHEEGPLYGEYSEYIMQQDSLFTQTLPDVEKQPTILQNRKTNYYVVQSQKNNSETTMVDTSIKMPRIIQKVPVPIKHDGRDYPLSSLTQPPPIKRPVPPRPQPPRQQHYNNPTNTTISQVVSVRSPNRVDYALPFFPTNRGRIIQQQNKPTPLISNYLLSNKIAEIVLEPSNNYSNELIQNWNQHYFTEKSLDGMKKSSTLQKKQLSEIGGHVSDKYPLISTTTRSDILGQTVHSHI